MGEACFLCVKGEDGKVQLKTLSRLDKPQYDLPAYKGVFTDEESSRLKTPELGAIKEMKDTHTGTVCNCYVSFHEPSNRIITMPVDAIKIPDYIYGKGWMTNRSKFLRQADSFPSTTYSAKRHAAFRCSFRRSENYGHRIQAVRRTTEGQRHYHGCQNHT